MKKRALKHRRRSTSSYDSSYDSSSIEDESDGESDKRSRSSRWSNSSNSGSDSASKHRNYEKIKGKHTGDNDPAHSTRKLIAAKTELLKLQKVREQLANKLRRLESHKGTGHLLSGGGHRRDIRHLQKELERIDRLIRRLEAEVRYYDTVAGTGVPSAAPVANQPVSQPLRPHPVVVAPVNNPSVKVVDVHQPPYTYDDSEDDGFPNWRNDDVVKGNMRQLINKPMYRVCPDGRRDFVTFMGFQHGDGVDGGGSTDDDDAKNASKPRVRASGRRRKKNALKAQNAHDSSGSGNARDSDDVPTQNSKDDRQNTPQDSGQRADQEASDTEDNVKTEASSTTNGRLSFEGYIKQTPDNTRKFVPHGKGIYTDGRDQYRGTFSYKDATDDDESTTTFTGLLLTSSSEQKLPVLKFLTKAKVGILYTATPFSLTVDEAGAVALVPTPSTSSDKLKVNTFVKDNITTECVYNRFLVVMTTKTGTNKCTEVVWWEEDCFANMRLRIKTTSDKVIQTKSGCGFATAYGEDYLPSLAGAFNLNYRPRNSLPRTFWISYPLARDNWRMEFTGNQSDTLTSVPAGMVVCGLPHGFSVKGETHDKRRALKAYVNGSLFGTAEYKKKTKDDEDDDDEQALNVKQYVRVNDNTFESKEYTKANRQPALDGGGSRESEADCESQLNGGILVKATNKEQRKSKLDPKWIAEFETYCTKLARSFKTVRVDERESLLENVAEAVEKVQQALRTDTRRETRNQLAKPAHLLLEAMTPCSEDNLAFSESFKLACIKLKQLFPLERDDDKDNDDA